jgi:LysR family glycine cleavage system transcriptional activator
MIIPVCSPRLLRDGPPLNEPRDLLKHTLAHIEWSRPGVTWPNWRVWMAAAGVDDFDADRCVVMKESSHVIQAAIEGSAVSLCDFEMVASDLSEGRLVRPFELGIKVSQEFAYYLVYPQEAASDPKNAAFRDWLLDEVDNPQMDPVLQPVT